MRIILLCHESLTPSLKKLSEQERSSSPSKTEYDVYQTLVASGHEVDIVGVYDELKRIKSRIETFKPHIAFNLLEEFAGEAIYDQNVVSFLELMKTPYTGCNPRGLMIARDKALTKEILSYHGIKVPAFAVFPKNKKVKRPKELPFPLIVKCLDEEASLGISQASVVDTDAKLQERVEYLHESFNTDVIAESFIEGREFYVGVMGNDKLETLPVWELKFPRGEINVATTRVKFNEKYRETHGIEYGPAKNLKSQNEISRLCKEAYRHLKLSGYARLDLRMTDAGEIYFIEANPNPDVARDEEFAESAQSQGWTYPELLEQLLKLGQRWASRVS